MKTEFENASFDNIMPLSGGDDDIFSDNIPVSKRAALLDVCKFNIIVVH